MSTIALALNLVELLNFLKTPAGQALAGRMLEERRDAILREAKLRPYSKRNIGLVHPFSYMPL